jgi:DNA-binding NarL/FixJ family response regulator
MAEARNVVTLHPFRAEPDLPRWHLLIAEPPPPLLTKRERQVLHALDRGLCDKEIAQELHIAVSTVKSHARSIYEKLEVGSRTAALHAARQLSLI